jgi:hypothetical protein
VRIFELLHTRFDTMAHYESALSDLAELLTGSDATLATSLADILAAAMQAGLPRVRLTVVVGCSCCGDELGAVTSVKVVYGWAPSSAADMGSGGVG